MTTITLQEYLNRINQLIEDNHNDEALAHCRRILETYPSHIGTYRLMAKASLEQHDYDAAADLFQRVLSAEPNDFISHVGMSMVRTESSQMNEAIWHLERAFEIQPYNAAIQEELRQHYAQNTEELIDRIPLTSGALARLYIRGELYHQAVRELRQTVKTQKDRIDLEVLLAEALWLNNQRIDAEEVCLKILQRLPNCIMANAILSEIWLQTGRLSESQKYLSRLQDLTIMTSGRLDMDTVVGRAFRTEGAPPLPPVVEFEFEGDFAPTDARSITPGKEPSADWMSEVNFGSEAEEEEVSLTPSSLHSYDWMADVNDAADAAEPALPDLESEWFVDKEADSEKEEAWLQELSAVDEGSTAVDDLALMFSSESETDFEAESDVGSEPDWFEDVIGAPEEVPVEAEEAVPDWLSNIAESPDGTEADEAETTAEEIGTDWFDSLDSAGEIEGEAAADGVPDWLDGLVIDAPEESAEPEEPGETSDQAADAVSSDSILDRLVRETSEIGEPVEVDQNVAELSSWLADLEEVDESEEGEIEPELPPAGVAAAMIGAAAAGDEEEEPSIISEELDEFLAGLNNDGEDPSAAAVPGEEKSGMLAFPFGEDEEASPAAASGADLKDDDAILLEEILQTSPTELSNTDSLDSDWLKGRDSDGEDQQTEEPESVSDGLTDFLSAAEISSEEPEELPDWILEESGKAEAAVVGDNGDNDQEQPKVPDSEKSDEDWLSDLRSETEEENGFSEESIDDFPTDGLTAWLSETPEEIDSTSKEPAAAEEIEGLDLEAVPGGLTAWLSESPEELNDVTDAETTMAEEVDLPVEGLTAWLSETTEDAVEAGETVAAEVEVPAEGLTAWLLDDEDDAEQTPEETQADVGADIPHIPSEELFATDIGNFPDWLADATDPLPDLSEEGAELPDWLQDGGEATTDVPAALDSEDLFDIRTEDSIEDIFDKLPPIDDHMLEPAEDEAVDEGELTAAGLTALLSTVEDEPITEDVEKISSDTDMLNIGEDMALDWLTPPEEPAPEIPEEVPEVVAAVDDAEDEVEPQVYIGEDSTVEDMDDAMSWLEDLASQQETPVDDMPTVAEDLLEEELAALEPDADGETIVPAEEPEAEAEAEEEGWLDVLLDEEAAELEAIAAAAAVEEEAAVAEPELDMDEAMTWLRDIVDESEVVEPEIIFSDPALELEPEDEIDLELHEVLERLDTQLKAEGIQAAEIPAAPPVSDTELATALLWLEGKSQEEIEVALEEIAAVKAEPEAPGLLPDLDEADAAETSVDVDAELFESTDEDMAWLESMTAGDDDIEFDMEPPPITPSEDAQFVVDYEEEEAVAEAEPTAARFETEAETEIGELLPADEAAADADLATLPDEDDGSLDDLLEMPEDPDEAMAWLEAMASSEDDIEFDMEPPPITPSEDAKFIVDHGDSDTDAAEAAVVEPAAEMLLSETDIEAPAVEAGLDEIAAADLAEIEDEDATAWLEAMAGGEDDIEIDMEPPPITPSDDAQFVVDYIDERATAVPEIDRESEDILDEVPDDPDEAMAWLEKMAGEQSAEVEAEMGEIPVADDAPLPAWMDAAIDDNDVDENELEMLPAADSMEFAEDFGVEIEDDLSDSLPDWFPMESQETTVADEEGWLETIEEINVDSWLEAEAEVTTTAEMDALSPADFAELSETSPALSPLELEEDGMPAETDEIDRSLAEGEAIDNTQLGKARSALSSENYEEAAASYQSIIAAGTVNLSLITELETLADDRNDDPAFRRLLGDAYMRNGQLQKALNTYRTALDQL